jgi:hypothetical protein
MTPRSNASTRRWLLALGLLAGCAGTRCNTCPEGRTMLDDVCVTQQVADYVSCVRAQGAKLGEDRARELSTNVGAAGVDAQVAAEVRDSLWRTYEVSDANVLEIIRACDQLVGAHPLPSKQSAADVPVDLSGEWDSAFENGGEAGYLLTFSRVGDDVTFSMHTGHGQGTLYGRVLEGTWRDRDVAGNPVSGQLRLEFSADGRSFSGYWTYAGQDRRFWWRGTRRS